MSILLAAMLMASPSDEALLLNAVTQAIENEIEYGLEATIDQDIDRYMEGVPADMRIVEEDGSITDAETLRAIKLREWAIIPRTNSITMDITNLEVGCDGECATVWTDQMWDRQMLGRDGTSEHNVVTTQSHQERWEVGDSRWVQVDTIELGGTTIVDGEPYE